MAIESLEALYLDELSELYDAERQCLRLLSRLQEATHTPALRELLKKHSDESRLHMERLQLIFTHWGTQAASRMRQGLTGIIEDADDRLHDTTTVEVSDVVVVAIARRMEHYEMAGYGVARALASRLNRSDEARLLQETLDDETRADIRFAEVHQANGSHAGRTTPAVGAAPNAGPTPRHGDKLR